MNDFQAQIFNGNQEIINNVIAKASEANVHYCTGLILRKMPEKLSGNGDKPLPKHKLT